jgi:hypothetical protein
LSQTCHEMLYVSSLHSVALPLNTWEILDSGKNQSKPSFRTKLLSLSNTSKMMLGGPCQLSIDSTQVGSLQKRCRSNRCRVNYSYLEFNCPISYSECTLDRNLGSTFLSGRPGTPQYFETSQLVRNLYTIQYSLCNYNYYVWCWLTFLKNNKRICLLVF